MIPEIKESLVKKNIIGLVIPDIEYDEILIKVAGAVSKDYNKILYVSVNKPYEKLINEFTKNKIESGRFYFIDCITRTSKDVLPDEKCVYVSSPKALDEIRTAVFDILYKQEIDFILIDSPSALLTYCESMGVLKFMHLLTTKLMVSDCKGIIPFPKESSLPMRRSIEMFLDDAIYLS